MRQIIDYDETFCAQIAEEELIYWGDWGVHVKDDIHKYDVFKIALDDLKYAGHVYGKFIGDLFYFDIFIIKEEFRNREIGTFLLGELIEELKAKGCKSIMTTAEYIEDRIALEPLLLKFAFKKVLDINGYWGSIFPDVHCKDCNSKPCKCKAAVFIKELF